QRLQRLPRSDRDGEGAAPGRALRPDSSSCRRSDRSRRRCLHPRQHSSASGCCRRSLSAAHADLPQPVERGGASEADRLYQVLAGQSGRGTPMSDIADAAPDRNNLADRGLSETQTERVSYLRAGHTLSSWLLTTDHKRIAILYLLAVTFFFFVGGAAAVL